MTSSFPRFPHPVEPLTPRLPAADFTAGTALDPEKLAPLIGYTVVAKIFPGGHTDTPAHIAAGTLDALHRTPTGNGTITLAGGTTITFDSYDAITLFHP